MHKHFESLETWYNVLTEQTNIKKQNIKTINNQNDFQLTTVNLIQIVKEMSDVKLNMKKLNLNETNIGVST